MTGQGGWPTTVFMTPDGTPFYAGTYFPPEPRHGMPRSGRCCAASPTRGASGATTSRRRPSALVEARSRRGAARGRRRSRSTASLLDAGRARARARRSSRPSAASARAPKFPPASALEFLLRRGGAEALAMARRTLDGMAAGGHVRPRRRRLPPLLGRRPLARAALREDALRQRAARLRLPARAGSSPARSATGEVVEETLDYVLRELLARRRRARVRAGRRHRRRRRAHVHVDARGRRASDELLAAVRARPLDRPRRARRRAARAAARGPRASGRSRSATTRRSPPGTASRSRRSPRRATGSSARTGSRRPRGSASSCSARSRRTTAACIAPAATAGRAAPGYLDDYANVAHGLYRAARRDRRARAGCTRRGGSRCSRSTCSPTRSAAASSSPRRRRASSSRGTKDLDDNPIPSGNSMLASVLLRLGADLGRRRARAARRRRPPARSRPRCRARRRRSAGRSARSTSTSRRRASSRSSATPDARRRPRRARAASHPNTVVAFGPADDVPLLAGKALVDGQAGGLRLRALRVSRAGDTSRRTGQRRLPPWRRPS